MPKFVVASGWAPAGSRAEPLLPIWVTPGGKGMAVQVWASAVVQNRVKAVQEIRAMDMGGIRSG